MSGVEHSRPALVTVSASVYKSGPVGRKTGLNEAAGAADTA